MLVADSILEPGNTRNDFVKCRNRNPLQNYRFYFYLAILDRDFR